jgi:hypothetical protein
MNPSSAAMYETTASPFDGITIPLSYLPETCVPIMFAAIFGSLAWFAVGLRTYTRLVIVGKYGYDDLVMTIALVCLVSFDITCADILDLLYRGHRGVDNPQSHCTAKD